MGFDSSKCAECKLSEICRGGLVIEQLEEETIDFSAIQGDDPESILEPFLFAGEEAADREAARREAVSAGANRLFEDALRSWGSFDGAPYEYEDLFRDLLDESELPPNSGLMLDGPRLLYATEDVLRNTRVGLCAAAATLVLESEPATF